MYYTQDGCYVVQQPCVAHIISASPSGNVQATKTGLAGWKIAVIAIAVVSVVGLTVGLSVYYTVGISSDEQATTTVAAAAMTTTTTAAAGPLCISCDSSTDTSCTVDAAPATTIACPDTVCYIQKNGPVITRGCFDQYSSTRSEVADPTDPGQAYCFTNPPGTENAPVICICKGQTCNDDSYAVMGGSRLEVQYLYYASFSCVHNNVPTCYETYQASAGKVSGCDRQCAKL